MPVRDWSSDVCSSDLHRAAWQWDPHSAVCPTDIPPHQCAAVAVPPHEVRHWGGDYAARPCRPQQPAGGHYGMDGGYYGLDLGYYGVGMGYYGVDMGYYGMDVVLWGGYGGIMGWMGVLWGGCGGYYGMDVVLWGGYGGIMGWMGVLWGGCGDRNSVV